MKDEEVAENGGKEEGKLPVAFFEIENKNEDCQQGNCLGGKGREERDKKEGKERRKK